MAKKSKLKPEIRSEVLQMRFQLALKLGYIKTPVADDWWDTLTNHQKSMIQGQVTKLMIAKAQTDMMNGSFNPNL